MKSVLALGLLIPLAPILGAMIVLILLISFNRTINRLTKPVSYLLIVCVGLSTVTSFLLFQQELFGQIIDLNLVILTQKFHLALSIDKMASIISTGFGLLIFIVMLSSYLLLDRRKGYVRYFIALAMTSGSVFSFILSGEVFHRYFR